MGFKEENKKLLESWKNDPWFPAIEWLDGEISAIVPGYEISQIKEKFGGLRFYCSLPSDLELPLVRYGETFETKEDVQRKVIDLVSEAERWVDGFESGIKYSFYSDGLSSSERYLTIKQFQKLLNKVYNKIGNAVNITDDWRVGVFDLKNETILVVRLDPDYPLPIIELRQWDKDPVLLKLEWKTAPLLRAEAFELSSENVIDFLERTKGVLP